MMRIARGSGRHLREVMEMLEEYKRLAKIWSKMKGLKIPKKGEMSALSRNMNAQHMSKVLPPQMLKQIRHGWVTKLDETDGFYKRYDGDVRRRRWRVEEDVGRVCNDEF